MRVCVAMCLVLAACYRSPAERDGASSGSAQAAPVPCEWAPSSAGAPVDFRWSAGSHGAYEPPALEQRDGTYALYFTPGNADGWFDVFSPDGGELARQFSVWHMSASAAQADGFQVFGDDGPGAGITVGWLRSATSGTLEFDMNERGRVLAGYTEPLGGTAILWMGFTQDLTQRVLHFAALDAHATLVVPDRVIASPGSTAIGAIMGSTTTGERLVLWRVDGTSVSGHGVWLASDGTPGASFTVEGMFSASTPAGSSASLQSLPDALRPLADGTLALRVDGAWRGTLAPGATSLGSLPTWLQSADAEEHLAMVAGGRGYALYQEITAAGACTAPVRLIDVTGAACGTVTLDLKSSSCNAYSGTQIALGAAGTLFAFLPTWDPHFNAVSGVVRRWPGLLR